MPPKQKATRSNKKKKGGHNAIASSKADNKSGGNKNNEPVSDIKIMPDKDLCMHQWKSLVSKLTSVCEIKATIMVDKELGMSVATHCQFFMKVFEESKATGHSVLVANGKGALMYKFRGKDTYEPVEIIGVPLYDTLFYISMQGHVAVTGTGATMLMTRISSIPHH
eukprot:CAMPEP_0194359312 /NCGR_PEP_ID=MMETSP0174-20130528/6567_1 /TAXON_ID=216777 /ORGANISM="Proboscia alata, Strain PI-D3" /LENGTH=165 /DNA_ID=CAMNT_0039130143 /DNA_START=176 /DNA_END=673 /DNA_ORIENTATION=-